jgi:hypothetical protein
LCSFPAVGGTKPMLPRRRLVAREQVSRSGVDAKPGGERQRHQRGQRQKREACLSRGAKQPGSGNCGRHPSRRKSEKREPRRTRRHTLRHEAEHAGGRRSQRRGIEILPGEPVWPYKALAPMDVHFHPHCGSAEWGSRPVMERMAVQVVPRSALMGLFCMWMTTLQKDTSSALRARSCSFSPADAFGLGASSRCSGTAVNSYFISNSPRPCRSQNQ